MSETASTTHTLTAAQWDEALARVQLKRRRGKQIRPAPPTLGKAVRSVTRKHLKTTGASLAKLRDTWPDLVGEKLSRFCRPEKLTGTKSGRTLTLKVLPAAAALIQHQSETIRQRLSVAAGGNITQLKLIQGDFATDARRPRRRPRRALSIIEERQLQDSTQEIENPRLREAIVALGRAVLTDSE